MSQPASTYGSSGGASGEHEDGIPVSAGLRILMGIGFLAVGLVQGFGIITAEDLAGASAVIDGLAFFLLAGTGVTMLMDRFYSLYLLLLWAILGAVAGIIGEGPVALPALFSQIMVAIVVLAAIGQRGAAMRAKAGGV
ncbi:hypothetical protein ACFL3H_02610 [Gemmatimonadota bacterium]